MNNFKELRQQMINDQLVARGIRDQTVLNALNAVPREAFIPADLVEFAYKDAPLSIEENQTISQPYIVALMTAALELQSDDRVLEVGTGSGYAAAVLGEICEQVYTIERHKVLADTAQAKLKELGYTDVQVRHGDGTLGWPENAPFNAIIVAAGGPEVPQTLKEQLAIGGRMVIPVGTSLKSQKLVRIQRISNNEYKTEELEDVRFVPLIGAAGWKEKSDGTSRARTLPELIGQSSESFTSIDNVNLDNLLERIGDSRVVLLGEASHGTAEFYDMRARITKELIEKKGFTIVTAEADWPDAAHINRYIQGQQQKSALQNKPFSRFPTWMWANQSTLELTHWLHDYNNKTKSSEQKVGFYGLDLYSLYGSIDSVLDYLQKVDPKMAKTARERYGCLMPWSDEPSLYGRAVITQQHKDCEIEVLRNLQDLLKKRLEYSAANEEQFFDAEQNAKLVADAERYYRTMYYAEDNSWNQRDQHMIKTLQAVLDFKGPKSKAVVWAHNSHIGDARATQMSARGELNIGQLARQKYGEKVYNIGFGTDHGTVAAASDWGGPMEIKQVQPSHIDSYERIFHDVPTDNFLLPLRYPLNEHIRKKLLPERLERAIGVIYRPETERQSHYFYASLPSQFDEYIWFDKTRAVEALTKEMEKGAFDTFPFGV
ncbi:MAG: protein-L-isoaspartate(D-aspartate) O-methyltransferase [Psychrobacter sp.]|nr:protein-L-isoaspartate(D-aspartate) O-methyltransferase [Psychrobacter sp.]